MSKKLNLKMSILVVDDMASMTQLIAGQLRELGFTNVQMVLDGNYALDMLVEKHEAEEPIEFIISDWNMPQMTGLALLRKCREDERFKGLPFMMVTAEGNKNNIIAAVEAGVSNYIVKPFSRQVLSDKIAKIFN